MDFIQQLTAKYAENAGKRAKLIDIDVEKKKIELEREKIQLEKDEFEREVARLKLEEMRKNLQPSE